MLPKEKLSASELFLLGTLTIFASAVALAAGGVALSLIGESGARKVALDTTSDQKLLPVTMPAQVRAAPKHTQRYWAARHGGT